MHGLRRRPHHRRHAVAAPGRDVGGGGAGSGASRRDVAADARDSTADARDATADRRDLDADRRHRVAAQRDARADARDRRAESASDAVGQPVTPAHLERRSADRRAAAVDREHASADRAAWARDRDRAGSDRVGARLDRSAAGQDRGSAAQDLDLAGLDPVTGALLRGAGRAALVRLVARARREGSALTVAFLDVDGLKAVNDSAGHSAGDQLLREVVTAVRSVLRAGDLVVRHGGDEFLCALRGAGLAEVAVRVAVVDAALAALPHPGAVTVGLATLGPGETVDEVVARADADLYRRRVRGRAGDPA